MPPGSRRRKAAKKKMEEKIANSAQQEQGNGDSSKSHDEKDSDSGGDLNSPTTSQEHQNPLGREGDEKLEETQVGDEGKKVLEVGGEGGLNRNGNDQEGVVTKEVDFESKVVDIESVKVPNVEIESRVIRIESMKEPNVEIVKEEERKFGDSFGGSSGEEVEKKISFETLQLEELSESKEGVQTDFNVVETVLAIEPNEQVVSLIKEVILDRERQIDCQSEEAVQAVEVNLPEKIVDSSGVDLQSNDTEVDMLPPSNGTSIETTNGSEHPIESRTPANSDNQQKDVSPVLPAVRPTSWKSCCGLFDVLTGSNR